MISSRLFMGVGIAVLLALLMLANAANAAEAFCDACGDTGWTGASKLDEIGNPNAGKSEVMPGLSTAQKNRVGIWKQPLAGFEGNNATKTDKTSQDNSVSNKKVAKTVQAGATSDENSTVVRSEFAKTMLVPIEEVSDNDVFLDISKNATEHIKGSIAIPYTKFLHNGNLKSVEEIAQILGEAGISAEDSLKVYGECLTCGGGSGPADLTYFMLKSMGHKKVRVLDGTVRDWARAGKPTSKETATRPPTNYIPQPTNEFLATYDLVKSGSVQIVDGRPIQEYGNGSIPGAINIPTENMISNDRIKDEAKLEKIFAILNKNQPVVAYTGQPTKGSVAWFSLKLLGFDAKLYSYENYLINQAASKQAAEGNATA